MNENEKNKIINKINHRLMIHLLLDNDVYVHFNGYHFILSIIFNEKEVKLIKLNYEVIENLIMYKNEIDKYKSYLLRELSIKEQY